MTKKRVYEIGRERGLETKQVMRRLQQAGVEVKAAASTVSDADIERVFGPAKKRESVSPATAKTLPSWLTPTATAAPRTTSREALEAKARERERKKEASDDVRKRAIEKARRLRAQRAQQAQNVQSKAEDLAAKAVEETPAAAPAAEAAPSPVDAAPTPATEQPAAEAAVAPAAPAESVDDSPAEVAEVSADTPPADEPVDPPTAASSPPAKAGPKIVSRAADAQAAKAKKAPAPEAAPQPPAASTIPPPATDLEGRRQEIELRKRAQQLAVQRAAELSDRRRAKLEAERLEAEQKARDGEKVKRKDRKKGATDDATAQAPEFIGSRRPRPSRESLSDADRGGRRGPQRRRRVIIDAQASRRGDAGGKRGGGRRNRGAQRAPEVEIDYTEPVTIHAGATVKELADALHVAATEVIKVMMSGGDFVTITQSLTSEQIELVGIGVDPPREIIVRSAADEDEIPTFEDPEESLEPRAPVVTIMGHVDHGKTSLLDAIRSTKVTDSEAGGITQHIGAYQVVMGDGRSVTFLDTPGHEAFTALRARGANVTDEVVLVVAADDGVKPQTLEAIDHARAAEAPILVAINKIDKENAAPERVKAELAQHDLQSEDWGGSVTMVEVSAKKRQNLDELIEMILLQADVLELKANPDAPASGYIIEAKLDPGRGPVCTMLVQRGMLHVGDPVLAGAAWGKVRAMSDFRGQRVKEAGPAMPVEIVGFSDVPQAGDFCTVVESERTARDKAQRRGQRLRAETLARRQHGLSLDDLFNRIKEGEIRDLNLVVKADVGGSLDAIEQELGKIGHDEVQVRVIHSGVGGITASDVMLASASNAIILGFNVRPNAEARQLSDREGVDVRSYRVIYKLREDVENALSGLLAPEDVEEALGEAEVREVFRASRVGAIAGCHVTQGKIERNAQIRLLRDGAVVYEGKLASLKRFKDDVREVAQGFECGCVIENFNDVKEGDVIEAYVVRQVERDIHSKSEAATPA